MSDQASWVNEPLEYFVSDIGDGGTPTRDDETNFGGIIPWVVITDVQRKICRTKENLTAKGLASCTAKLWPQNSIILSTGATIGKVGIAQVPLATKQGITGLVANDNVLPEYLYYELLFKKQNIVAWAQGSTFAEIRVPILKKIPLSAPKDTKYQKKIASILEIIDQAIEKTEALIHKYQQIKAGLMHDLFTRGLTTDGKLRPPREQAPELYQETPIGWIPKEWSTNYLKRYVKSAEYGISTSLGDLENGIPVLRMNNIQQNSFDISDLKYSNNHEAYRIKLKLNDVLYNRTNSMEHVGKTAIWKNELEECSFASYLVRINLHEDLLMPEYFSYWMSQVSSQNSIRRFATPAVQQVNINPTNLQKIIISAPVNLDEQSQIVNRLKSYDRLIDSEKQTLFKLKNQKLGLMHDLLTGKVPVKIDQAETAHV